MFSCKSFIGLARKFKSLILFAPMDQQVLFIWIKVTRGPMSNKSWGRGYSFQKDWKNLKDKR